MRCRTAAHEHILPRPEVSRNQMTEAVDNFGVHRGGIQPERDWHHMHCRPTGVCFGYIDGETIMTLVTFTDHLRPTGIKSFAHQDRRESDGLFAVTVWSITGVGMAALTLSLELGGQVEPLIGLA
jgi:hypothetical protein